MIDVWVTRETLEPQRGAGKPRTVRTDDTITYTVYMKTGEASTYTKEIQSNLVKDKVCLPENVPSKSSISRILKDDLGYSYKKISCIPAETERPDVQEKLYEYIAVISGYAPNQLHFFDESSIIVTSGNRRYGHSAVGKPAFEVQRYASNATYTLNLMHNLNGVTHFSIIRGPSNGLELINFFEEALQQKDILGNKIVKPGDVIVMDNCGFHHGRFVEQILTQMLGERQTTLCFQPPYHPCYNTCESCFAYIKNILRRYTSYTEKYTELCVSDAVDMISPGLSRQFFKLCGYL